MTLARWPVVVVGMLVAVGCGGSTFTAPGAGDGGGSSSGSTSSGSGGGSSSGGGSGGSGSSSGASSGGSTSGSSSGSPGNACPSSPPAELAPCPDNGLECEWGASPDPTCNEIATCANGTWAIPMGGVCASSPPITCPATYASVPRMTHCSAYGGWCDYPQGRCACTVKAGGAVPLDASAEAIWICQDPSAAGCPTPRPHLGSPCSQQGLSCDYGACDVPGGSAEQCAGGVWAPGNVACPLAAAGAGSR